uniref:Uncharacterized protein n=1 Tax=Rhizophora mucronata TaxID=61149 RepID=A0A2P2N4T9_RHIMU
MDHPCLLSPNKGILSSLFGFHVHFLP